MRKIHVLPLIIVMAVTMFCLLSDLLAQNALPFVNKESFYSQVSRQEDKLCGPRSLKIVCQLLGIEANIEELARLSGMSEETGTTMLGLYLAAQCKGFKAIGMRTNIEELSKLKTPSIVHINGNHFFVVECFEEDKFRILNLPKEPYYLTKKELSQTWDGIVLIISRKPPFEDRRAKYHF